MACQKALDVPLAFPGIVNIIEKAVGLDKEAFFELQPAPWKGHIMQDGQSITVMSFGRSSVVSELISACAATFVKDLRGFLDDPAGWCPQYLQPQVGASAACLVDQHLSVMNSVVAYPETKAWRAVRRAASCREAVEVVDASVDKLIAEAAEQLRGATSGFMSCYLTIFVDERAGRLLGAAFSEVGWGGPVCSLQYLFTRRAHLCSRLLAEAFLFIQTTSRDAGKDYKNIVLYIDNSSKSWTAGVSYCRAPMMRLHFTHGLAICSSSPPEEFVPTDVLVDNVGAHFPTRLASPAVKKAYWFFNASTYASVRPKLEELTAAKRLPAPKHDAVQLSTDTPEDDLASFLAGLDIDP